MIYGNRVLLKENNINEDPQIIEEAFFMSRDGKEVKKKIKTILKDIRKNELSKTSFTKRLRKGLKQNYDNSLVDLCSKKVQALFNPVSVSSIYQVTQATSVNGIVTVQIYYRTDYCGIYKNSIYCFTLQHDNYGSSLFCITENNINKFNYPRDIVEYAIKNNTASYILKFSKNGISSTSITKVILNKPNMDLYSKIDSYINQKYNGVYITNTSKITGNLQIRKISSSNESAADDNIDDENNFEDESSIMEYYIIKEEVLNEGFKYLHKITPEDLSKDGSYLSDIWKKEFDNMKENGKENKIGKYLYSMYFAIVGNCFGYEVPKIKNGENIKYKPKFNQYWSLCKKYLDGKYKATILKDVDKTIDAAEKFIENHDTPDNKVMIDYYKAYIKDLGYIK